MSSPWWRDDDQLLAVLDDALTSARAVPVEFVEAGKAAYAWRTVDAELAALTYDSAKDNELAGAIRAESATLRALTFASAELTIELDVTPETLFGQISPVQSGRVTAYTGDAGTGDLGTGAGIPGVLDAGGTGPGAVESGTAEIDELGFFTLRPVPDRPFRLLCRTSSGTTVLTGWVSP